MLEDFLLDTGGYTRILSFKLDVVNSNFVCYECIIILLILTLKNLGHGTLNFEYYNLLFCLDLNI